MPKMLKSRARDYIPESRSPAPCPHPHCDKVLSRKNDLRRHIRTHTREGAHKCPYSGCDKLMLQKGNLVKHITAVHENKYPYTCPDCPEGFNKPTLWSMHRQKCHGYVPQVRNYRSKVVTAPKPKRTARKPAASKRVNPYIKTRDCSQSTPSLSSGWSPSPSDSDGFPSPSLSFDFSLVKKEAVSIPGPSLFWHSLAPPDNDKKPVFMDDSLSIEDVIYPTLYQTSNDFMEEQQLFAGNDCTGMFSSDSEAQRGFYTLQEPSPANNFDFQGLRDTIDYLGWNDNIYQQSSFQVPTANGFNWDSYHSGQLPIQNHGFPEHGINESFGDSESLNTINSAQFNPYLSEFYF